MRIIAALARSTHVLRRFARDNAGATALIFALSSVAILTAGGAGIDLARALVTKHRLAEAIDAAALAVGSSSQNLSKAQMTALAQKYFDANYPYDPIGTPGAVNLSISGQTISLSVSATVNTTLLKLAGFNQLTVSADNAVTRENKGLEVVLALDNTGSMAGSKLRALKDAADTLIDTLSGGDKTPTHLKIGLVPFTQTVKLDTDTALSEGWIDTKCRSSVAQLNFDHGYCAYTVLDTMSRWTSWAGCVEARPNGLAVLDTAPSSRDPDTLFVPYFQPDEPDGSWYYTDNYLDDGRPTDSRNRTIRRPSDIELEQNAYKYAGQYTSANNEYCDMPAILPLTNDMSDVKSQIDDMTADGSTHIVLGVSWGWRVLSPSEPYTEGAPYDDPDTQKVLILMTDGENTVSSQNTMNGSTYTAFGYLSQGRLGTTSSTSRAENTLDSLLSTACSNVKSAGIRVYTIGFQINTSNVKNLLRNCATDSSMFYDSPTSNALSAAFTSIATDLSNLRLSR